MRALATAFSLLLILFLSTRAQAQNSQLTIQQNDPQTFTLSYLDARPSSRHTFIESTTNRIWFPAFFSSSNSIQGPVYTVVNAGGTRLFKATQAQTIASQVKASWQRLGVTNYIFHYSQQCLCAPNFMVSGTVTIMGDHVVKIENARDSRGNPVENPSLSTPRTINQLFDAWISSEPEGGYARQLEFDSTGFPTSIFIDVAPQAADDELIYIIDSFTPLP